jgi:hypothetical protein
MEEKRLEKLRQNLAELEERIGNLLGEKADDTSLERVRKHKKVMREIQEYYSKKVS